ncbi:unnamed protein product [Cylindrotheca closterium]|uniref:Uncharacterized protein n=1 Tax=Cylindrotheca closterium TaxID=2856 RepID=A0AAD2FK83_9STRA|nr:unnamed protein product [Cylindrotheca closterium]
MRRLTSKKRFSSLTGRVTEDDEFSLDDDVLARQPSSTTSLFNDYGFSDDEEDVKGSFKIQDSLYFDESRREDVKEKIKTKKQPKQPRPSGALEDLLSPALPEQAQKQKTGKRSPKAKKSKIKSRNSSDQIDKKTRKKSVSKKSPSVGYLDSKSIGGGDPQLDYRNQSWNQSTSSFIEVNESDYETDTDDDLEFGGSDSKKQTSHNSLVERALSKERSSLRRSLSKKRVMDALSVSNHRKEREEVSDNGQRSLKRSLSAKRMIDALALSSHKKDNAEAAQMRTRRAMTKKDFLEGSSPSDFKPKRSSSLKSSSSRHRGLDTSNHSTRSSSKPRLPRNKSFDEDAKCLRSPSSSRKKKIGLDYSNHSERSSSVTRKKNKDLDRSSHSSTPKRSSSVKRKKKDQLNQSTHLPERGRRSASKTRVTEDSGFLSPGSTKQKGRRVPIKKQSSNVDDETTRRKLNDMSLSTSEHGRPRRSSRVGKDSDENEKLMRKMKRRNSSSG